MLLMLSFFVTGKQNRIISSRVCCAMSGPALKGSPSKKHFKAIFFPVDAFLISRPIDQPAHPRNRIWRQPPLHIHQFQPRAQFVSLILVDCVIFKQKSRASVFPDKSVTNCINVRLLLFFLSSFLFLFYLIRFALQTQFISYEIEQLWMKLARDPLDGTLSLQWKRWKAKNIIWLSNCTSNLTGYTN